MAPRAAARELAAPSRAAGGLDGLYEAYAPELRRRCLRLTRDGHAADDLMQEVFVRFLTRFPEPPTGMNVGAYLHATARNVLWKQLRDSHEVSDGDIETTVGADDDLDNDPERSALLGEQQSLVRRCAAVLTGRQRRALTMRDVEGRSYDEIGSELGIGTGAVMQVISRARARLRVAVRRANVDLDNLAPECVAMLGPLSDYLDGRAAATEKEVEAHLATCDDCCHTLATYQEAGSRLRGFLPLVPLGGILARFRGRLRTATGRTRASGSGSAVTTHGPTLTRIGNALGRSGDGPLGATGVGAMVTAAVIAVAGGSVVVAQHVTSGSGSGHALAATATAPLRTHAAVRTPSHAAALAALQTTVRAQPYGGYRISPSGPLSTPAASATPAQHLTAPPTAAPPASPTVPSTPAAAAPSTPATGGRAVTPPKTTPVVTPAIKTPVVKTPAVKTPAVKTPAIKTPAIKTPAVKTPALTLPVKVPAANPPAAAVPGVTVPPITVPPTPVAPPVTLPAIALGASDAFGVVAGAGVTNTGPSVLTGDIGSFPTLAITGLATLTVNGVNQAGGAVAQQAKTDLAVAYDAASAKAATAPITADIGGRTLAPGVYRSASSIGLTGAVTLDGKGDPNAVFVFQAGSTLTTASASQVVLVNGARSCNVFWQVGSSATLGTASTFRGTILALTSVTVTTGVTVDGRILARNGAVTLDSDLITRSAC